MFKIQQASTFIRGDLLKDTFWYTPVGKSFTISGQPFSISLDGSLVIVKDDTEAIREMTEEEKMLYTNKVSEYAHTSVGFEASSRSEPSMKITVKKKQQGEDHGKDTQEEAPPSLDISSCPICYADFPAGSMVILLCGHRFCYACISTWIETKIGQTGGWAGIDCPSGTCGSFITSDVIDRILKNTDMS